MKKRSIFLLCVLVWTIASALPNAWINEIHYDNAGADVNEFVEVVVESPETVCLWDLTLYMYNGADGKPYCLDCISEFTPGDRVGPYQFYTWFRSGIQNDMEGMILVYFDSLVHIMAYEGSFYGTRDPATGVLFPDVGVSESGSSPVTASIYLTGLPGDPWAYGEQSTPGSPNPGQVFSEVMTPVRLGSFTASAHDNLILLTWESESELECSAYRIYREDRLLAEIPARGTVSSSQNYSYRDMEILQGSTYHYVLSEITFDGEESLLDSLEIQAGIELPQERPFQILSPFPNPFNPGGTIPVSLHEASEIRVDIINLKGEIVMECYSGLREAGDFSLNIQMPDHPSGTYFLRCQSGSYSECRPFVLMK